LQAQSATRIASGEKWRQVPIDRGKAIHFLAAGLVHIILQQVGSVAVDHRSRSAEVFRRLGVLSVVDFNLPDKRASLKAGSSLWRSPNVFVEGSESCKGARRGGPSVRCAHGVRDWLSAL